MGLPAAAAGQIRTRLNVLFAAAAPRAVILRRGPRAHWRLITWDLRKDVFTPGQWMVGLVRLCDLSPSGDKIIYWAAQHHRSGAIRIAVRRTPQKTFDPLTAPLSKLPRPGRRVPRYLVPNLPGPSPQRPARLDTTWTAISTPPYFTALALWPAFGHWTGGGMFHCDRGILIQEPENRMAPIESAPIPRTIHVASWFSSGRGLRPSAQGPSHGTNLESGHFWEALVRGGATWVEWVHHHENDDLLFACDGCVYRLKNWQKLDPPDYLRAAKRIADFRDMRFEAVTAPPDAMKW